jgi:hypothetical protein
VISEDLNDANGNVDAVKLLGVLSVGVVEGGLLVDDGIDGDGSLSSLSVTDNELSLATTNRDL